MSDEPKKETVRITLPPRPLGAPGGPTVKRETVRINLPPVGNPSSQNPVIPQAGSPTVASFPPAPAFQPRPVTSVVSPIPSVAQVASPMVPPVSSTPLPPSAPLQAFAPKPFTPTAPPTGQPSGANPPSSPLAPRPAAVTPLIPSGSGASPVLPTARPVAPGAPHFPIPPVSPVAAGAATPTPPLVSTPSATPGALILPNVASIRPTAPGAPVTPLIPPVMPKPAAPVNPVATAANLVAPAAPVVKPAVPANVMVAKSAGSDVSPVAMKPSPKKETARIQIPTQPKDLPKATVKLQQTQLLSTPTTAIRPAISPVKVASSTDSLSLPLSIGAFVFALIAFLIQIWTYL